MSETIRDDVLDVINTIMYCNVRYGKFESRVGLIQYGTTYRFSQKWEDNNIMAIIGYIQTRQPELLQDFDNLMSRIKEASDSVLEQYKKQKLHRQPYIGLSIFGILVIWELPQMMCQSLFIDRVSLTSTQEMGLKIYALVSLLSLVCMGCGLYFLWRNFIKFPEIKDKLRSNSLTVDDCLKVEEELPTLQERQHDSRVTGMLLMLGGITLAFIVGPIILVVFG